MTGQEAVDAGWADEVISAEGVEPVNMKLTPDKSRVMVNGHSVAACLFGKLPENIPAMTAEEYAALSTTASGEQPPNNSEKPAQQARNNTHTNGGNHMDFQTPDELRNAFPELVAQIEAAARTEGITAERNRIQSIETIQNAIGDADMIRNAKFGEKPMNAQELAFAAMQKQAAIGNVMVNNMITDTANSGAGAVAGGAAPTGEPNPDSPEAIMAQAKADVAAFQNMKEVR